MVLANKGYLRDLKRLFGFKSFEYYWDESYDEKDDIAIVSNSKSGGTSVDEVLIKLLKDLQKAGLIFIVVYPIEPSISSLIS